MKKDVRIVFMGTPDFAVPSLKALHDSGYNIVGVVTAPDRASGRGQKVKYSPVKEYALENDLYLLQPEKLKNEEFLSELKLLQVDLQVVVAFRMLPKQVWDLPNLGTFNLHASLLPQYRGAAPIHHALINGEKITGLTTFFIDEKIDTGKIIDQAEIEIMHDDNFGSLHNKMMSIGAHLVVETVNKIVHGDILTISQENLVMDDKELRIAPKIYKDDCRIDWNNSVEDTYNFIRGLSPFPCSYSYLHLNNDQKYLVKIYRGKIEKCEHNDKPGSLVTDHKTFLKAGAENGFIKIEELQLEGKRRMTTVEFLRGFNISESAAFE